MAPAISQEFHVPDVDLARNVVERIPGFLDRVSSVTPLAGGITNRNYRVESADGTVVVRLNGKNTELLGIDRNVEHKAARQASGLGIAPAVLAFVQPGGYLVTEFLDAQPVSDLSTPDALEQVTNALRLFHGSPELSGRFPCFTIPRSYAATALEHGLVAPPDLERSLAVSTDIAKVFEMFGEADVPCHNDLLNANFLQNASGKIWVIDWEYAGMNSRWFDLGNLTVNNDFDHDACDALLLAYFGEVTAGARARLELMQVMSDLREATWGVVQQAISLLDFDFKSYAAEHFDRLLRNASRPSFATALELATTK